MNGDSHVFVDGDYVKVKDLTVADLSIRTTEQIVRAKNAYLSTRKKAVEDAEQIAATADLPWEEVKRSINAALIMGEPLDA